MFKENIPIYLKKVTFASEKKDGETRKICRLAMVIAPFTAELAESVGAGLRRHLFKTTDGEALDDVLDLRWAMSVTSLQEMRIKLAPDQPGSVIVVQNCRADKKLRIRRDKETPTYEARFNLDFPYPIADVLQFLANNQNEQLIVSLQDEQTNMLDEQRPEKARKPKLKQPPLGAEEPPAEEAATVQ